MRRQKSSEPWARWYRVTAAAAAVLALLLLGATSSIAKGSVARHLPLSLKLSLKTNSKSIIIAKVSAKTTGNAVCDLILSVRHRRQALPKIRTVPRSPVTWQWSIVATSPSGRWHFHVVCAHGAARGKGTKTARITPRDARPSGPFGDPNSLTTSNGQRKARGLGGGANPFPYHQCTWLAYEKRPDIYTVAVGAGIPAGGSRGVSQGETVYVWDGMMWYINAQKAGESVGSVPQTDALVSFGPYAGNPYGHVAYVEQVSSPSSILVSQCDGFTGVCGEAWIDPLDAPGGLEGYVYGPKGSFNPAAYNGHIVKQNNGTVTSWLVTNGHRNWIPDQATYNCLKTAGHPGPDYLSSDELNQLPDQSGVSATCSSPPPPPDPTFPVMNTSQQLPDGVFWRSAPDWNTPVRTPGVGFFTGTYVTVHCYQLGVANVPYSTNHMWVQASWASGPGSGSGWMSEHFVNDGAPNNQAAPGVPPC